MSSNTIEILTSINKSVLQIVNNMAPQNSSGEKTVSKLNKGGADVVANDNGPTINVKTDSIQGIVKVLSGLSPVIKTIAGLSDGKIKRFKKVVASIIGVVENLEKASKKTNPDKMMKMVQSINTLFDVIHKMMTKMGLWIPLAPLALIGALLAIPVILVVMGLFKIISMFKLGRSIAKSMKEMMSGLNQMVFFLLKMTLVSVLMMGLGYLLMSAETNKFIVGGLIMFGIVVLMTLVVMGLTWLASLFIKAFAYDSLKQMITLIFAMTFTLIIFSVFGMFIDVLWKPILIGFGLFLGVCGMLMLLVFIAGFASRTITNGQAFKSLAILVGLVYAAMGVIVVAAFVADFVKENWLDVLIGIGCAMVVVAAVVSLAKFAEILTKSSKQGLIAMALISAIAFASLGIIYAAIKVSDEAKGKWEDIGITLAALIGLIAVFGALAFAAGYIAPAILLGAAAIASISLFVLSSLFMIDNIIAFQKRKEESGVSWEQIYNEVNQLRPVIQAFAALATIMGIVSPAIILGMVACATLIPFVMSSVFIVDSLIAFRKSMIESGATWDDVHTDLKGIIPVIRALGTLATTMSITLPFVILGTIAVATLTAFITSTLLIVKAIEMMRKIIDGVGGKDKLVDTITVDLKSIMKTIDKKNFDFPMSGLDLLKLTAKYAMVGALVSSVLLVGVCLSKVASLMGLVDENGNIYPVLSVNEETGEIKYGQPVNLKQVAQIIVDTIKVFTNGLSDGLTDVKTMFKAAGVVFILGALVEPVNSFVKMLTGYESAGSGDNQTLAPITIDDEGKVHVGKAVNVKQTAQIIADTISTFVNTLFSQENADRWAQMLYGDGTSFASWREARRRRKGMEGMMSMFSMVLDPVSNFIDVITSLEGTPDGKLRKWEFKDDGTIKTGAEVDVVNIASTIATTIGSFATTLFNNFTDIATKIDDSDFDEDVLATLSSGIDMAVRVADSLGKVEVDALRISSNALAIQMAITSFTRIFTGTNKANILEATKNKEYVDVITSIANVGKILSELDSKKITANATATKNATDTITDHFKKADPILKTADKTVLSFKDSLKSFDDVLVKDNKKRTDAIKDLAKNVSDLIKAFSDENGNMSSLSSVLNTIKDMDTSKIKDNIKEIKKLTESSGQSIKIDYDKIKEKITESMTAVLDGMSADYNVTTSDKYNNTIIETHTLEFAVQ